MLRPVLCSLARTSGEPLNAHVDLLLVSCTAASSHGDSSQQHLPTILLLRSIRPGQTVDDTHNEVMTTGEVTCIVK